MARCLRARKGRWCFTEWDGNEKQRKKKRKQLLKQLERDWLADPKNQMFLGSAITLEATVAEEDRQKLRCCVPPFSAAASVVGYPIISSCVRPYVNMHSGTEKKEKKKKKKKVSVSVNG